MPEVIVIVAERVLEHAVVGRDVIERIAHEDVGVADVRRRRRKAQHAVRAGLTPLRSRCLRRVFDANQPRVGKLLASTVNREAR